MQTNELPTPGCYIDSHHGHYAIPMSIRVAMDFGYVPDPFVRYALDRYDECCHDEDYPSDALIEVAQEAEDFLNGLQHHYQKPLAPEGFAWGWNEGDFGLYAIEDDEF